MSAGAPWRIVFTGPESTGKTWLTGRLAAELGLPFSGEAARELAESAGRALVPADIERVARRQIELEEAALAEARRCGAPAVLHDTDLVSTVVYGWHYNGGCPDWIERAAAARRADLHLLLLPDVPFVAEPGVRGDAADRAAQLPLFRAGLARLAGAVEEIGGDWEERAARARERVLARLALPASAD
ncbi:MAG: ATP-binding protein [Thermoanaerobaculia bacterium]|nr:ATP-binding protein [Thermoanaerobaculia bacterium]